MGNTRDTGYIRNVIAYDSSNNVGIGGAANASYKLQVTGTTNLTGALSGTSATFSSSVSTGGPINITVPYSAGTMTFLTQDNLGNGIYLGPRSNLNFDYGVAGNTNGYINFSGYQNGTSYFRSLGIGNGKNGTIAFFDGTTGNVGIGTPSPQNLLHLGVSAGNKVAIQIGQASRGTGFIGMQAASSIPSTFVIGTDVTSPIIFGHGVSETDLSMTTERMRITSAGNVGIGATGYTSTRLLLRSSGSTSSTYSLNVENSGTFVTFAIRDDGFIETGTRSVSPYNNSTSGRTMVIESGGGLGYTSSTRESKTNIKQLSDVSWLYNLNPVSFNYRKKDDKMNYTEEFNDEIWYGLIADEVEIVNQDLVFYNTKEDGSKQLAGVEYNKLISALVKVAQKQQAQIEELSNKIVALQSK